MEIKSIRVKSDQAEEIAGITPEYPFVMHQADMRTTHIPWHWHEEIEFSYMESGSMKVSTVNRTYEFLPGEGYFINSNILAAMEASGEAPRVINISFLFHPVFLSGHFRSIFETKYITPVIRDRRFDLIELRGENSTQKKMLSLLRKASHLQAQKDSELLMRNLFSEIWMLLLEEIRTLENEKTALKPVEQDRIQTMLSFIQANYAEHLTLADIASAAAISTRECTRCFKNTIHKTPFEYLMEYRIESAEHMLRTTDESILDIALKCGFSTSAYFGRIFREINRVTPGAYRKKLRSSSRRLP